MSDLISRQAAIDAIEKHIRTAEEPYQLTDADKVMNHAFEIAASCVYNLPSAQPEQRWIPCSERLPEHGGRYLISVLDGINRRTTVAPYQPRCKAWTMTGRMAYWKVIAWMPLPEPAKLGGD